MKLYNTLTKKIEDLKPLKSGQVSVYSCGPTVYDHVHIGNWRAFVFADLLRRALKLSGLKVEAVMNITDVDDKTIHRAVKEGTELEAVTKRYEQIYLDETNQVGIDMKLVKTVRATDELDSMRQLIKVIYKNSFAYVRDDGVYFSIAKFVDQYPYGVLSNIVVDPSQLQQRIDNDEYDKDDARDFALWKKSDPGEPSWDLQLDGQTIAGRPGWHIECSAMSAKYLGQPFDIHTGGIDLVFPHHENEIAQSRAANGQDLAKVFVHNEHLLVDDKKMSKSLNNFYTLADIIKKDFDPLALRLLFLQSHYRSQQNFTWRALRAAQNSLRSLQAFADRQFQVAKGPAKVDVGKILNGAQTDFLAALQNDLATPQALAVLNKLIDQLDNVAITTSDQANFKAALETFEQALGLGLINRRDITDTQRKLIDQRETARKAKDFTKADHFRAELAKQKLEINDTDHGPRWRRI